MPKAGHAGVTRRLTLACEILRTGYDCIRTSFILAAGA